MSEPFLGTERLLRGPWKAFERDVARLLVHAGFEDVRLVAGSGDRGADVLAVREGRTWVVQCKFTTNSGPSPDAVDEIEAAARFYAADSLVVACSRPVTPAFEAARRRLARQGVDVDVLDPGRLRELLRKVPEHAPSRRTLRGYQEDAVRTMRDALLGDGRALAVLATGLGKTVVMADLSADLLADGLIPHGRVLVMADKVELIAQLQAGFWHQLPKTVATHLLTGAEKPSFWEGITFATVDSVDAHPSLPEFGLVLVDEAHHAGSRTFLRVLDRLRPHMLAGATATPWRGDRHDIAETFGPALVRMGISDGLKGGFLSEVDYRLLADDLDWQAVQDASTHSYSLAQLNRRLIIPTRDDEAARTVVTCFSEERRRGGVVFSPSLEHAGEFAGRLRGLGLRAESVGSDLSARQRDVVMSRFRKGDLDLVTPVDLFNEGVDVPDVDLIVFMRATHSRRIFVQQLGRGLRLGAGKDKVIVLDFVTDLRRMAEVIELERAARSGPTERLPLGDRLVSFRDAASGSFLAEWLKDQADLFAREDNPMLEVPRFEYPPPAVPGGVA